jgi:hypothetical protein
LADGSGTEVLRDDGDIDKALAGGGENVDGFV